MTVKKKSATIGILLKNKTRGVYSCATGQRGPKHRFKHTQQYYMTLFFEKLNAILQSLNRDMIS